MDSYITAASYEDAHNYYVNFNFEVLQGCKHRCDGCSVNRKIQSNFTDKEAINFQWLLDDFHKQKTKPFIAFIGPTDFLAANNTAEFLSKKEVIKMLNKFRRLSFITTALDVSMSEEVADILNLHYPDMEIEINVALEPIKIKDNGYMSTVKENFNNFKLLLHAENIRRFAILNVFNYKETELSDTLSSYTEMDKIIGGFFDTTIDFNFSLGRRKFLKTEEFKERCFQIADLFDEAVIRNNKIRFSFGKLDDALLERQYNYRNGKFYYSPMLYERYVGFNEELEIPTPGFWSAEHFGEFEDKIKEEGYMNIAEKEECSDCPYSAMCIERGVHKIMDIYGINECIVAKKALDVINGTP